MSTRVHPSDPLLALSPVELAAGIDALYLSARGDVPAPLLDELDALKSSAREQDEPVKAVLAGYAVDVLGTAWGKYRFCLQHEMGRLGITASDKLPAVRFQPSSRALHSAGPRMTVLFLRNLLDALGITATVQVSRLDLHSDWQGFWIVPEERSNFVTYSDKRALYEVGDELSGLNFGKRGGALYGRIYDKCERSGKPVIGDHRKPTWSRCFGRRLVTLAGASVAGVGGSDLEAVVFA